MGRQGRRKNPEPEDLPAREGDGKPAQYRLSR